MEVNTISFVHHPHPVIPSAGRIERQHTWTAGETLRELMIRQGIDPRAEIVAQVNGRLIPVAEWDTLCPQPDDLVSVQVVVSGGNDEGGSNVGMVIMTIVVIVASIYTGGAASAAWGAAAEGASSLAASTGISASVAGAITTGVVAMAGNMIVGALFKPSGKALSDASGVGNTSPTYSLSGGSNSLRPYEPMPIVMGSHRMFPDFGAKPYTEYRGEDQYLYQLFNFGTSALELSDFRIGETLLSDYEGVEQKWSDADGNIPGFPGNVDSITGAALVRGAAWTTRTSSVDSILLAIDLESQAYYSGGNDLVPVTLTFEAQYSPAGANTWSPFSTRSVITAESTHHWSLQTTQVIDGTPTQNFVAFGSTNIADHLPLENQAIGTDFEGNTVYGQWYWLANTEAIANGWPMPETDKTWGTTATIETVHPTQKAIRQTIYADVAPGQYDVRVRLTSAMQQGGEIVDGDTKGSWSATFATLRSYQQDQASYKGQRRMGLIIKASGQLNGVVRQISCLAEASCYLLDDADNVTFGKTSNPAWWFLNFAMGTKNADGEKLYGCHLPLAAIDVESIVAWAAFCDTEGLRCDLILDRQQSAHEALTTITKCGLASPSWGSGKLGVIWDKRNASPVAMFGMSNIIKGTFSVQYLTENMADEIVVNYVDRNREWSSQQVRKTVPGVTTPEKTSTVELMGCTTEAQAGKYANYLAASQYYRRRMMSWETDFEGFVCQRGDVVMLSHDLTQWGYSGRLVSADGVTITLDRKVPRTGSAEYLMLSQPDGSMDSYTVAAAAGRTNLLRYSEQRDNAAWSKTNCTVTPNAATAPDGLVTMDKLIAPAAAGVHYASQTFSTASGTTYFFSDHFASAEISKVALQLQSAGFGSAVIVNFDLAAKTATPVAGSPTGYGIEEVQPSVFRCWISATATSTTTGHATTLLLNNAGQNSFTGDGSSGIYAWGADLKTGSLSDYIKTEATTVTVYDDSDTLTLTAPATLQPDYQPVDHRWMFSPLPTPGKKVKIVSVRPVSASRVAIVATDEDPAFYTAWDGTFTAPTNPTLLTGGIAEITAASVSESVLRVGDSYVVEISLALTTKGDYASSLLRVEVDGVLVDETQVFGTRYTRIMPSNGLVTFSAVPVSDSGAQGVAFTKTHSIAGLVGLLPAPVNPTIYASPDAAGHVARAKVSVRFAESSQYPITGLAFFLSVFTYENAMTIASGGTGSTLTINASQIVATGTVPILAGSTPDRIVVTTAGSQLDTSVNLGGFWWAKLTGGEWKKCTGLDATAYLFNPPHEVTPVPGQNMDYAAIAWADERVGDYRLAILKDGSNYEVIKWAAVDQAGPGGPFQLTGCERGQEGTTPISADGKTLYYYPAPGVGTKVLVFPAEAFQSVNGAFEAETDIDFVVPPGHYASISAGVFYQMPNGEFIRSHIVPAIYGGPL